MFFIDDLNAKMSALLGQRMMLEKLQQTFEDLGTPLKAMDNFNTLRTSILMGELDDEWSQNIDHPFKGMSFCQFSSF